MTNNDRLTINFDINEDFFQKLHQLMQWEGREQEPIQHIKNALELYSTAIHEMAQGKILTSVNGENVEKLFLPPLLAQFKYEKELQFNKNIEVKKQII